MPLSKRAVAEFIGTFWLVFGGCGSAVLAAAFPGLGIGFVGVALAFGLTVLTMAFAIGHVSGCHLNPAVSVGLVVGKRFPISELPAYVIAQVLGGVAGSAVLYTHRDRQSRVRSVRRICLQWLRRAFSRRLQPGCMPDRRSGADVYVSHDHSGSHRHASAQRIRTDRDRPRFNADSSHRDSGDEPFCDSRAQHGSGSFLGLMGARTVVAVLGGTDRRRSHRRRGVFGLRYGAGTLGSPENGGVGIEQRNYRWIMSYEPVGSFRNSAGSFVPLFLSAGCGAAFPGAPKPHPMPPLSPLAPTTKVPEPARAQANCRSSPMCSDPDLERV